MWDARAFTQQELRCWRRGHRGCSPGMLADFTVLTQDILAAGSPEILKETRVAATFVEGECVYER